jgi:hypothetical protein
MEVVETGDRHEDADQDPRPGDRPIATLHDGRRARSAIGVKLPAMSTKIMEWSRCFIIRSARGDHERRWYAALVPYTALRLTAKIAAPT